MSTERLTDDMITTLHSEAGAAGDSAMVAICEAALDGDEGSRVDCAEAITDARAMDDSKPLVRVAA
jgi:hypothetical protein